MQLAMSMAFVSGNLSANNMFQFARRLEMDMETIAINNTTVGFSHGSETFGWCFYPRFQTPDTDSNVKVFFQDLLCGGPNRKQLLRERMLARAGDPRVRGYRDHAFVCSVCRHECQQQLVRFGQSASQSLRIPPPPSD